MARGTCVERVIQKFRLSRCLFPLCISLLCAYNEKSQSMLYRKLWVFSGYSGFLPQGMLPGSFLHKREEPGYRLGIALTVIDPSTVVVLFDHT